MDIDVKLHQRVARRLRPPGPVEQGGVGVTAVQRTMGGQTPIGDLRTGQLPKSHALPKDGYRT
jgi:hypothetical protein